MRSLGQPPKTYPVRREVVDIRVVVHGTGDRGGGGSKTEESKVWIICGGASSNRTPPLPPSPQASNYYQHHRSDRARSQAPVRPVDQSQGRQTRHWLGPVLRWEASEFLLLLVVSSNFNDEQSQRGGERRVDQERAGKGSG